MTRWRPFIRSSRPTAHRERSAVASVLLALALVVGALPSGRSGEASVQAAPASQATAEVIVSLAPGVDPGRLLRQFGISPKHLYRRAINGFAADVPAEAVKALRNNPEVVAVVPDRLVQAAAVAVPTGVDRIDADRYPPARIDGRPNNVAADVAVLDSGIAAHPDLNVVGGKSCIPGESYRDGFGHGTHVAGTIGARDNGNAVVGVAPGVRLWAVKVLDNRGFGSDSSVICGLEWVIANGRIDVVNMSLGAEGADSACSPRDPYHNAVCNTVKAGVAVVVAAGNTHVDASRTIPATWAETIAVSAFADFNGRGRGGAPATCYPDRDDTFADFSNFGPDVDIAAPGVCIYSTSRTGGYELMSGTSMAAPHVAGAAALYKAARPNATPAGVRLWLTQQMSVGQGTVFGFTGDPDRAREPVLYLG